MNETCVFCISTVCSVTFGMILFLSFIFGGRCWAVSVFWVDTSLVLRWYIASIIPWCSHQRMKREVIKYTTRMIIQHWWNQTKNKMAVIVGCVKEEGKRAEMICWAHHILVVFFFFFSRPLCFSRRVYPSGRYPPVSRACWYPASITFAPNTTNWLVTLRMWLPLPATDALRKWKWTLGAVYSVSKTSSFSTQISIPLTYEMSALSNRSV